MKKSWMTLTTCVVLSLGATACGGDDNGGGGGSGNSGSDAATVAQSILDSAKEQGVTIDEGCINDAVAALPEADLKIMVDNLEALDSGEANVDTIGISEEGMNGLNAIFDCAMGS